MDVDGHDQTVYMHRLILVFAVRICLKTSSTRETEKPKSAHIPKKKSKGWIALKWQILWETNKFQVSFCSPFKFVRRFFVEKKRATANNKGADQSARTRRLICAFVVHTYIKAGFLSDSRHRSSTSCTTFVWTALQWRTTCNIHTLKHWVYFSARMNTKLNSSQSQFL